MEIFPVWFLPVERLFETTFCIRFPDIGDRQRVDIKSLTNRFVGPIGAFVTAIGFQ